MIYTLTQDKIIINQTQDFNIAHILECGQVFRYTKIDDNTYNVFSSKYMATIKRIQGIYEISTNNVDYFVNYFDLDNDYSSIKSTLNLQPKLKQAIEYGYGIRILKQAPLETVISFIISANNNIPRIKKSLNLLCERFGTNCGSYYGFPDLEQLSKITQQDFEQLGTGYRAGQLVRAIQQLSQIDLSTLYDMPTQQALQTLLNITGVGPKVADCILLFAFHNMNVFPVDTWIEKMYNAYFSTRIIQDRKFIRQCLTDMFGNLSGYAQQYLFYYKRFEDGKNK